MLAELAAALRGLGKHAEAQRCCTSAVTARPDYQRGWLELGRAQAAQGGSCCLRPCWSAVIACSSYRVPVYDSFVFEAHGFILAL